MAASNTEDKAYLMAKVADLEQSLSNIAVKDESMSELLQSISDIKNLFQSSDKETTPNASNPESLRQEERKMERRLSQINDKEMEAMMNDILPSQEDGDLKDDDMGDNDSKDDEMDEIDEMDAIPPYDALICMAGGLKDDGSVYQWVANRLDLTFDTYNEIVRTNKELGRSEPNPMVICTGGGTYHKAEIRSKSGFVIHESTALVRYLIEKGMDTNVLIREWASYDTIASVYFTLVTCVMPREFKNVAVITSTFHMPRVKLLFEWIFGMHKDLFDCKITFLEATDDKSDVNVIQARTEREKKSAQNVKKLMQKLANRNVFHKWLFTEHKAYACNYINEKKDDVSEEVKKSY